MSVFAQADLEAYPGQCVGREALLMADSCVEGGQQVKCLTDPCDVAPNCTAAPDAICVSKSCPTYFRQLWLAGICQAVFVDVQSGEVVENCSAGLA